jgi:peptide/nickel transport system permease protein
MHRYVARRFFQALIALFMLSIAIFIMGRLSGNPCDVMLPPEAGDREFVLCAEHLQLNEPVWVQYRIWISEVVRGDFGRGFVTNRPVIELIQERFPNSIRLGLVSILFTTIISLPMGLVAAVKKDSAVDVGVRVVAALGQALPSFWLGTMLIWLLAVKLRLLPVSGMGGWKYYVMPVLTMGWSSVAAQSRMLRSSMLEVMDSEFIKLARIKGVSEVSIIFKHTLRNALIPVTTLLGLHFAQVITSGMIAEVVFAWPGLGRLLYEAIKDRDFPIVQACVLLFCTVTILCNLVVDILYVYIDPRIRHD